MLDTATDTYVGETRFSRMLSRNTHECPAYDRPLLELHDCVVVPTIGSILPYWLLVVPRGHSLNFRRWQAQAPTRPDQLIDEVLSELGVAATRAIWFEHGPGVEGTSVGCGVDHAHLHIIVDAPFCFDDFVSTAAGIMHLPWRHCSAASAYQSVSPNASYLLVASARHAVVAEQAECAGSQFLRRVVAELTQHSDAWNYTTHPHMDNVQKTISAFSSRRASVAAL